MWIVAYVGMRGNKAEQKKKDSSIESKASDEKVHQQTAF